MTALPAIFCRIGCAACALDQPLPPFAFGRALFHLAQRRGFQSNRKNVAKEGDNDEGESRRESANLKKLMQDADARTLGEYFAGLDPEAEKQRIRKRGRPGKCTSTSLRRYGRPSRRIMRSSPMRRSSAFTGPSSTSGR